MGVTNFPNGLNSGDASGNAADLQVGGTAVKPVTSASYGLATGSLAGTAITGAGTVAASAFGLTTVTAAVGSLAGTATGYAGTASGKPITVKTSTESGAVVVRCFDALGAAASAAGTVGIIAHGSI